LGLPIGKYLPTGAKYLGKLPRARLDKVYAEADWLVHPSNFEGFSLSILEALGVGVPVIASTATGAADLPRSEAVQLFEPENPEQLVEALIRAKEDRGKDLSQEARRIAEGCSWEKYRGKVKEAVRPFA
jgi:glycosyltransferase involved in cell wall biosynthesis